MPLFFRNRLPAPAWWLIAFGFILTGVALLPFNPVGPFDPRDWEPVSGAELTYPWMGALIEPIVATGHALAGAPFPKAASLATLAWVLGTGVLGGWLLAKGERWRPLKALGFGVTASLIFLAYVGLYFLVPFPSWKLTTKDPQTIIADLQSHTYGSHDSIIAPMTNLRVHQARGVEVVAITEHQDPAGAFRARRRSRNKPDLPTVIPGVELRAPAGYILGLGVDPGRPLPDELDSYKAVHNLTQRIRKKQNGTMLALGWRLDTEDVSRLTEAGIAGFEIANMAHPDVPDTVRQRILNQARSRDLALVANSDWHGWTGAWRTWTLIRPNGPSDTSPADQVLASLRNPDDGEVVPVVAGYLGPPPDWRVAFAPLIEGARYAAGLTPARLLGWWLWLGVIVGALWALQRRGLQAGPVLGRFALAALAVTLIAMAAPMAVAPATEATNPGFHQKIGGYGILLGSLTLLAGFGPILLRKAWHGARKFP